MGDKGSRKAFWYLLQVINILKGGLGGIPPEAEENFIILHLLPGDFLYSGQKSDTLEGVVQEYQYIPSNVKPANFHVNFLQHCYIHPCIFSPSLTPGHC